MSSFSTRWSVLRTHDVEPADLDEDGLVADAALRRWIEEARSAYLDQCSKLQAGRSDSGIELRCRDREIPPGAALGRPAKVVVSASATEVFRTSFVISVRLRAAGGGSDELINAACTVELGDATTGSLRELDPEIRDELIALEHSARHFN